MSTPKVLLPALFQLPSVFLEGSSRSAGMPHAGPFQITAFAWALECVRFCIAPCKSEVYFLQPSHSPGVSHTGLQSPDLLEVYLSSKPSQQDSQSGSPKWSLGHWLIGVNLHSLIILSFWVTCLGEWVLTIPCTALTHLVVPPYHL